MRQAEIQKKKILPPNSVDSRPRQENSEKNSKKIEKIKKTSFRHYFLPKRDEIGREREKKNKNFTSEFRSCLTEGRKLRKKQEKNLKNLKTSFRHYSQPKRDEIGREREKKKFYFRIPFKPDSSEKIPKKIAKELKKFKKNLFPILISTKTV